jgi:predicted nucleotidyltransferase
MAKQIAYNARPLERRGRRNQLYAHEYPIILNVLSRLAEQIAQHHPEVTLLALFGSVARMTPHADSDTDLLVLVDKSGAFEADRHLDELSTLLSRTIRHVVFRDGQQRPEWGGNYAQRYYGCERP